MINMIHEEEEKNDSDDILQKEYNEEIFDKKGKRAEKEMKMLCKISRLNST